jgi:hypothetical protein
MSFAISRVQSMPIVSRLYFHCRVLLQDIALQRRTALFTAALIALCCLAAYFSGLFFKIPGPYLPAIRYPMG